MGSGGAECLVSRENRAGEAGWPSVSALPSRAPSPCAPLSHGHFHLPGLFREVPSGDLWGVVWEPQITSLSWE